MPDRPKNCKNWKEFSSKRTQTTANQNNASQRSNLN